jgi:hypothetical protein
LWCFCSSDTRPGPGWEFLVAPELAEEDSVLAETGREGLLVQAAADPESYICPTCGGVVARRRKAAHDAYWCEVVELPDTPSSSGSLTPHLEPEPQPMVMD